ncbi:CBF1 interacting corepressor [Zea mays]|uniref:CBF1 interacting corepressor n=1 Tax=Zea mays TaxID=4577 RepID=A0A1D6J9D0_MAIZE|nr:CBF1 interacting corepressor [Zea mays]
MGKNQAYKAMQRARLGSSSGAPGAADAPEDGMSGMRRAWPALTRRTPSPGRSSRRSRRGELEADKDKMMREYRAQLDAERAQKLANGRNHSRSNSKSSSSKKERKDKDAKKRSKKRRKHKSSSESSSSSSSESSSSDDEDRGSRKSRSRSRSKRTRKEKKSRSRSKRRGSESEEEGPVRLSKFFGK